jgi:hypothetical protein
MPKIVSGRQGRPYQDDYSKMAKTSDPNRQRQVMVLEKTISEERKNRLKDWVTFYRLNIDIFALHYLGLNLHFYQRIWLYLMNVSDIFVTFAARACGKTWLLAVLACCRAILYPGSECVIVSSTQKQASLLISEKIARLKEDSFNLNREIKDFSDSNNKWEVVFYNGSKIKVVAAGEGGRGKVLPQYAEMYI